MNLYILGAGAHGRVVVDILRGSYQNSLAFLDDDVSLHGELVSDIPVIGTADIILKTLVAAETGLIIALGNAPLRLKLTKKYLELRYSLINAIHEKSIISPSAGIGRGVCICAGSVINTDTIIEDAVIINTGSTVDHDCFIGEGAQLSPGVHLSGRVKIGSKSFLGIGVSVGPRVNIGMGSIIGAGSIVLHDIPDNVLAYGSPAKVIKKIYSNFDWRNLL